MTATNKHSLISCYTNTLFENALCIVKTSQSHSTYAHIYAHSHFSCATQKYCSQLHLQLQVTTSQGLALPHQKHIRYHGRNCLNARTRSPASKKPGSMSQRWPGTTGAEHSHRNFSFKNRLIASQLLQHFFWKPSVKDLRVQSLSPSQFSDIKYVIHVQE